MKGIPKAFRRQAQVTIVFDGFDGWKLASADPIH